MIEKYDSVLRQIAMMEGIDVASLFVENGIVFRLEENELIGTVCQTGTPFWKAAEATADVLARFQPGR